MHKVEVVSAAAAAAVISPFGTLCYDLFGHLPLSQVVKRDFGPVEILCRSCSFQSIMGSRGYEWLVALHTEREELQE